MHNVTLDTNIYISAVEFGGAPAADLMGARYPISFAKREPWRTMV